MTEMRVGGSRRGNAEARGTMSTVALQGGGRIAVGVVMEEREMGREMINEGGRRDCQHGGFSDGTEECALVSSIRSA